MPFKYSETFVDDLLGLRLSLKDEEVIARKDYFLEIVEDLEFLDREKMRRTARVTNAIECTFHE